MSPSDAPNFTRPTPDCEIDFRSQFHSTDFADSACAEGLNGWGGGRLVRFTVLGHL